MARADFAFAEEILCDKIGEPAEEEHEVVEGAVSEGMSVNCPLQTRGRIDLRLITSIDRCTRRALCPYFIFHAAGVSYPIESS